MIEFRTVNASTFRDEYPEVANLYLHEAIDTPEMAEYINEYCAKGWEFLQFITGYSGDGVTSMAFVFKREVP